MCDLMANNIIVFFELLQHLHNPDIIQSELTIAFCTAINYDSSYCSKNRLGLCTVWYVIMNYATIAFFHICPVSFTTCHPTEQASVQRGTDKVSGAG